MKINHPDSPCSAPAGSCGLVARLASVAFMLLPFLPANAFELDLRTAHIEANAVNESQKRAIKELEKHLLNRPLREIFAPHCFLGDEGV